MTTKSTSSYSSKLKSDFNDKYKAELKKELGLSNINAVPSIEKIVVNIGLGKSKDDKKMFEVATNTLEKITGQKPIMTYSRVNIASFKLREGNKIGMKVTLRGERMYEFLDRLVNIVLPRQRDFHGVSNKSFDAQGNYSIGIKEQSIFPELSFEETTTPHGLQVVIATKSNGKDDARALLVKLGVPFMKEGK